MWTSGTSFTLILLLMLSGVGVRAIPKDDSVEGECLLFGSLQGILAKKHSRRGTLQFNLWLFLHPS